MASRNPSTTSTTSTNSTTSASTASPSLAMVFSDKPFYSRSSSAPIPAQKGDAQEWQQQMEWLQSAARLASSPQVESAALAQLKAMEQDALKAKKRYRTPSPHGLVRKTHG